MCRTNRTEPDKSRSCPYIQTNISNIATSATNPTNVTLNQCGVAHFWLTNFIVVWDCVCVYICEVLVIVLMKRCHVAIELSLFIFFESTSLYIAEHSVSLRLFMHSHVFSSRIWISKCCGACEKRVHVSQVTL